MISQADQKFMRYWAKTLQKGRLQHHLTIGVLWALFFFVFVTLFDVAAGTSFLEAYFSKKALIKLGIWLITGVAIFAPLTWWDGNRRYKMLKKKYGKNDQDI